MYQIQKKWTTAKKQEYNGFRYDSGFEANYAQELDLRIKAHDIQSYQPHVNLDLVVNGYRVCQYEIDFIVTHNDGTLEYVECKGWPSPVWRLKWKIFEALYSEKPGVKLTIIQQGKFRPPKIHKTKI